MPQKQCVFLQTNNLTFLLLSNGKAYISLWEKIELTILDTSGQILAEGNNRIWYNAEYQPGDHIVVEASTPGYYVIRLEDTLGEELVYKADNPSPFPALTQVQIWGNNL